MNTDRHGLASDAWTRHMPFPLAGPPPVSRPAGPAGAASPGLGPLGFELAPGLELPARGAARSDGQLQTGHCEIGPVRLRPGAPSAHEPADAPFYIWFIERGELCLESRDGSAPRFGEGALLLRDSACPLAGHWGRTSLGFVRLSRRRCMQLLGHEPSSRGYGQGQGQGQGQGLLALDRFGLAPFLGSQLRLLGAHGASLGATELREALAMVFHSAEVLLRLALSHSGAQDAAPVDERLQAVHRYIDKNLHRQDLSVEQIAAHLNSSRAQLYRLFESQPVSVHGSVREARLQRSFEYLQRAESRRLSIGAIAHACGFSDQSVFSKLFRQRFGMTPSAAREPHGSGS